MRIGRGQSGMAKGKGRMESQGRESEGGAKI